MAEYTKQQVIDFLQEIRRQEMQLDEQSSFCREHNFKVEAQLFHEKVEILRKLGNKMMDHFEMGWVNYPK